jgi:hypothetical protein
MTAPDLTITEEDYDNAIDRLSLIFGSDASELVEMIEAARDEDIIHNSEVAGSDEYGETHECTEDCVGCLTGKIADVVTRAVNSS